MARQIALVDLLIIKCNSVIYKPAQKEKVLPASF